MLCSVCGKRNGNPGRETCSSNRCFNMNSDQVIRGIEKAKKQVNYLMAAKNGAKGQVSDTKVSGRMEQRIG